MALALSLALAVQGCAVEEMPNAMRLVERWAVPLDGSFHGVRDAHSVTEIGGRLAILDRVSLRIHMVSDLGEFMGSLPVPTLPGGTGPTEMVSLDGRHLLLASYDGSVCIVLDVKAQGASIGCALPHYLAHKAALYVSGGRVVVLGRRPDSNSPIHLLRWVGTRLVLERSIGSIPARAATRDSTRLLYGVGVGAVGDYIVHTRLNPVSLTFFSREGKVIQTARPRVPLPPVGKFKVIDEAGEERVGPFYPHVTGLQMWAGMIAVSAYSPARDLSTFWMFSEDGEELGQIEVSFRLSVREAIGGLLVVERDINGLELVAYSRGR